MGKGKHGLNNQKNWVGLGGAYTITKMVVASQQLSRH